MWEAWIFLAVSVEDVTVQGVTFIRILNRRRGQMRVRHGLVRTAACRVVASVVYVGLGIAAINQVPQTANAAFTALMVIRFLWQANALLDARLSRRLSPVSGSGSTPE